MQPSAQRAANFFPFSPLLTSPNRAERQARGVMGVWPALAGHMTGATLAAVERLPHLRGEFKAVERSELTSFIRSPSVWPFRLGRPSPRQPPTPAAKRRCLWAPPSKNFAAGANCARARPQ